MAIKIKKDYQDLVENLKDSLQNLKYHAKSKKIQRKFKIINKNLDIFSLFFLQFKDFKSKIIIILLKIFKIL